MKFDFPDLLCDHSESSKIAVWGVKWDPLTEQYFYQCRNPYIWLSMQDETNTIAELNKFCWTVVDPRENVFYTNETYFPVEFTQADMLNFPSILILHLRSQVQSQKKLFKESYPRQSSKINLFSKELIMRNLLNNINRLDTQDFTTIISHIDDELNRRARSRMILQ